MTQYLNDIYSGPSDGTYRGCAAFCAHRTNTYRLVLVHDWYDSTRSTRIRCLCVSGNYYCSLRQKRDAIRRACVMSGSALRADIYESINVTDDDGKVVDLIPGA